MKKYVPVSEAFGNKDPVARDISHNYAWAMTRETMQKVSATLARAYHHNFSGRLGRMVAPIFARASRPAVTRTGSGLPSPRIDT